MALDTLKAVKDVQYDKHPPLLRRSCAEGTREQILHDLMRWARDSKTPNIYWVYGMAGTGKTTIARLFCEQLTAEGLLGASFFCSRTIEETREVRVVFPTIARELASRFVILPSLLVKAVKDDQDIASSQPDTQLARLIHDPLNPCLEKPRIVALDAFDEFKTVEDARILLKAVIKCAPTLPNIKFLITSRPENKIKEEFDQLGANSTRFLSINTPTERDDINIYLNSQFREILPAKQLNNRSTQPKLEQLIVQSAPLFIYASTVCSFLNCSANTEEFEERLDMILTDDTGADPESKSAIFDALDQLYNQILKTITQARRKTVLDILRIIITALSPLSIPAIASFLGIKKFAVDAALTELSAIITHSGDADAPVLPFHISLAEFLLDTSRSKDFHSSFPEFLCCQYSPSNYKFPEVQLHRHMAQLCLDVLESPTLTQEICIRGKNNSYHFKPSPVFLHLRSSTSRVCSRV
jgi:hypothetical protein